MKSPLLVVAVTLLRASGAAAQLWGRSTATPVARDDNLHCRVQPSTTLDSHGKIELDIGCGFADTGTLRSQSEPLDLSGLGLR